LFVGNRAARAMSRGGGVGGVDGFVAVHRATL
jgi:hypothetical protein